MFITFEGVEGAGKSTQISLLNKSLIELGLKTLITKQPGGSILGEKIRNLILNPDEEDKPIPMTELLLYIADRAHHVETVIKPALAENKVVICDRYTDSTLAYQGFARGFEIETLEKLNKIATGGLRPVRTFLLDLNPEDGLERIKKFRSATKMDRLEREKIDFHQKVRTGFLQLAEREKERFSIINAISSQEEMARQILQIVKTDLQKIKSVG